MNNEFQIDDYTRLFIARVLYNLNNVVENNLKSFHLEIVQKNGEHYWDITLEVEKIKEHIFELSKSIKNLEHRIQGVVQSYE